MKRHIRMVIIVLIILELG